MVGLEAECTEELIPHFPVEPNSMQEKVLHESFWGPYKLLGQHPNDGGWVYLWNS